MTGRDDEDYWKDFTRLTKGLDFDDLTPDEIDAQDKAADAARKRANGVQAPREKAEPLPVSDFIAFSPDHTYIYRATGESWTSTAVNAWLTKTIEPALSTDTNKLRHSSSSDQRMRSPRIESARNCSRASGKSCSMRTRRPVARTIALKTLDGKS